MQFSCEKYILQSACSIASRAVAAKSPLPALEGLLLKAEAGLTVMGYDLKEGIYTNVEAEVQQIGSVIVGARLFNEMIRRLPDGMITVSADDKDNIKVRCGKSEYNFMGINASDYPSLPSVDGLNRISIPQSILRSMIDETIFAVATNDARPIYTGTMFDVEEDRLTLVSVDGFRLAKRTEKIENGQMENCSFIVPGTTLSDVGRVCGDGEENVEISVGAKHITFKVGNTVIVSRRLEGEFLNYKKSIPEQFRFEIKVDRNEFMSVIDRTSLFVTEKNSSPVRLSFEDDHIYCSCMTAAGNAEDFCSCVGSGDGLMIGFNDKYIRDALKAASKDELLLCLNSASSPCIIKAADGDEDFIYMVLPVRLKA